MRQGLSFWWNLALFVSQWEQQIGLLSISVLSLYWCEAHNCWPVKLASLFVTAEVILSFS